MKLFLCLPALLATSAACFAGSEAVAPDQPVFIPPIVLSPQSPGAVGAGAEDAGATQERQAREAAAAQAVAARIGTQIAAAQVFCTRVSFAEYQIDCLSDQLAQVAAEIPDDPVFDEARDIVRDTSVRLANVARRRPSETRRPANISAGPQRSSRPIRPIEAEDLPQAVDEAEAILDEAETLLLRASESSELRKLPYQQIAEAVGSTKLLLRSS